MSSTDTRDQFPILAEKAYFNACSYGPISLAVKAAIEQYIEIRMTEGARWDIYCEKLENVRELVASLLVAYGYAREPREEGESPATA